MTKTFAILSLLFIPFSSLLAQTDLAVPCRHNDLELLQPLHQNDPAVLQQMAEEEAALEQFTRDFDAPGTDRDEAGYLIPVVFHIIHENGSENISNAQIEDAVRILNEDFRRLNEDWDNVNPAFADLVADVGVEFRLARRDPQGNCTTGITRTVSPLTNSGDQDMKDLIQWPRNKYLNVWVAASAAGAAGYTYRPGSVSMFPSGDGIVMLHSYVGSIGTSTASRSRTLTHEVGHWINLAHTWGNSNDPGLPENCFDDDNVADTPNTIGWTSCTINGQSCGGLNNVENYMEYSYCSKMFTEGQATRMIAALNSNTAQRNQLWQETNLIATGITDEPELCAAAFSGNGGVICAGSTIAFQDESFHNVTSRVWNFPGGSPETSTDPDPVVTYAQAGVFPVTLTVSDGSASLSTTTEDFVTVLPDPGIAAPFFESFEEVNDLQGPEWTVVNNDGSTFSITNAVAYTGGKSVKLVNGSGNDGDVDELFSGTFDMSAGEPISISFRYAYARRNSGSDDRLRVYVSNNCGGFWSLRKQLRGSTDLSTAPNTTGSFVPAGAEQWGQVTIDNIPADYNVSDFRFKFHFESDGGNNLYIDDININGFAVGLNENAIGSAAGLSVHPNPANEQAWIVLNMIEAASVKIAVMDLLGQEVAVVRNGPIGAGDHRIELPIGGLSSGIYFVRLESVGSTEAVKFVVE